MSTGTLFRWVLTGLVLTGAPALAAENPFVGNWALTIPGGGAGWLGIVEQEGNLTGSILWGGGSVVPVDGVTLEGETLKVTRLHKKERKDKDGRVIDTRVKTELLRGQLSGDALQLAQTWLRSEGKETTPKPFEGKRIPPLPARPDPGAVKYGDPLSLIQSDSLNGWTLTNPAQKSGWRVEDGVLINEAPQEEGKPHIGYGNLRTEAEFEDFNLKLEVNVPAGGNSGVYLRGIYEIQVSDNYGKPPSMHGMGGIYSRIAPSISAEKPAGEWQAMDITLLERHVTVKLNGTVIIDNAPLLGCTGGALWSDQFRPGPIYLQGDHSSVQYRDIVLRPILK